MVATADTVEWIEVRNEVEALFLEFNLIKQHRPRFNIRLQGRQVLPVPRGHARRGVAPGDGDAGREAQGRPLLRARTPTPTRSGRRSTCSCARSRSARARRTSSTATTGSAARASTRTSRSARRRASARSRHDEYDGARRTSSRLPRRRHRRRSSTGSTSRCTRRATRSSSSARRASATRSSRCARRSSASRWSTPRKRTTTLIGIVDDELEASVQVFLVRKGRVVGRKGLVVDKVEDVDDARAGRSPARAALRRRRRPDDIPREILVPDRSRRRPTLYEEFLALQRAAQGAACACPQRGAKRELLQTVTQNARRGVRCATSCGARPTTTRAPARSSRCRRRSTCPRRRCASSASTSRTSRAPRSSASMVVMEDGLPKRSDYRRFKIRHQDGPGRLRGDGRGAHPAVPPLPRTSATKVRAAGKRFAYPPNLLLVDGGKGQLGVAVRVLEELGLEDICVASASPSASRRSTCPATPSRCASRATRRRCTCSSRCATRRTASPSRTTASSATRR